MQLHEPLSFVLHQEVGDKIELGWCHSCQTICVALIWMHNHGQFWNFKVPWRTDTLYSWQIDTGASLLIAVCWNDGYDNIRGSGSPQFSTVLYCWMGPFRKHFCFHRRNIPRLQKPHTSFLVVTCCWLYTFCVSFSCACSVYKKRDLIDEICNIGSELIRGRHCLLPIRSISETPDIQASTDLFFLKNFDLHCNLFTNRKNSINAY